jgi:hypothetical protein
MAEEHKHFGQRIGPFTAGTPRFYPVLCVCMLPPRSVAVLVGMMCHQNFLTSPEHTVS